MKSYLAAPKAHLIADIYIFRGTGNVTFGNETTEVQNGTMKFFVQVDSLTPHQTHPMICFRKCCRKEGGVSVGAGGGRSAIYQQKTDNPTTFAVGYFCPSFLRLRETKYSLFNSVFGAMLL